MSDDTTPLPAPGWYPDPAGTPRTRWWNGSAWSDTYGQPAAAEPAPPVSAPPTPWANPGGQPRVAPIADSAGPTLPAGGAAPAYGGAPVYGDAPAYGNAPAYPGYATAEPLKAPEGTSPMTPFIWPLALLPIIAIVSNVVSLGFIDEVVDEAITSPELYSPISIITGLIGWIAIGLTILFGVLDYRALVKAGVPKPFHWAWIFFAFLSAPVYIIGRSVVARRRTGSGLTPMFVNLALVLLNVVISIVSFVVGFSSAFDSVNSY